jgi:hypothetical protein
MSIIDFSQYKQKQKANVTQSIMSSFNLSYMQCLNDNLVDLQDPEVAFDVATVLFLAAGAAHRSQGEPHPSQSILNALRNKVVK